MMVYFSIMPVGEDSHLSEPISKALKIVHESGLEYKLTAMGTLISGDWKSVMDVVKKCHEAVSSEHERVVTQIKIDDAGDRESSFESKIKAVEEKAGIAFKK